MKHEVVIWYISDDKGKGTGCVAPFSIRNITALGVSDTAERQKHFQNKTWINGDG